MPRLFIFHLLVAIVLVSLGSCARKSTVTKIEPTSVQLKPGAEEDPVTLSLIAPYKNTLEKEMSTLVVESSAEAVKGMPEGTLGNLVADLTLQAGNRWALQNGKSAADISLLNNGGLRSSLPKGSVELGKIFELMPFENEVVILTISGSSMMELCRSLARNNGMPVSGLRMKISKEKTPQEISIQGMAPDSSRTYRIVTSDYLASGGDKMRYFKNPIARESTGKKLRDALIEEMSMLHQQGKKIDPKLDGRISNE